MASSIFIGYLGATAASSNGTTTDFGLLRTADGVVATPALAPISDPDTGVYFQTGVVRIAVGGANLMQFASGSMVPFGSTQLGSDANRFTNGYFSDTLSFGTHSAIGAETVTGFITITDAAGNSRKLAVVS